MHSTHFFITRVCRITSFKLHILAIAFMFCDHLYRTLFPDYFLLTCIGRLAFPLYAFLTVEGFFHTHDFRCYFLRLLSLAIISELPYNLLCGKTVFYPTGQNVIWTFLLALLGMFYIEHHKRSASTLPRKHIDIFITVFCSSLLGFLLFTDYKGFGILTVFVFYFFHGTLWWQRLGQFLGLLIINLLTGFLDGFYISIPALSIVIPYQVCAIFCFLFLWRYTGEQGYYSRKLRLMTYLFYPLHSLLLVLLCQ